jgi:hypothetical protein
LKSRSEGNFKRLSKIQKQKLGKIERLRNFKRYLENWKLRKPNKVTQIPDVEVRETSMVTWLQKILRKLEVRELSKEDLDSKVT